MIKIVLIIAVIALLWLGVPLLIELVRRSRQRRAAEQAARLAEEQKQRQELDRQWREEPDKIGTAEQLAYSHAVQMPLQHEADEARRVHEQRIEHAKQRISEHRNGKPVTAIYKVLVLVGLAAFLFASWLGLALDYLIFRGLHPTGTVLLPAGLACLAVLGITVGSIIFMNSRRHHLLPDETTSYVRNVVTLGGILLAGGIAAYMITIAPNRSIPAGEARINTEIQVLQQAQTAVPPSSPLLISQDQQNVATAKSALAHAEAVDRLSAGALALIEIPLSEAAVLGSGVLALELALLRRERARRQRQHAENNLARANNRFTAELFRILVAHGHGEEVVDKIRGRLARLSGDPKSAPRGITAGPQPTSPAGPAGPASPAGPAGPASPASGQPGPSAPGSPPGMPNPPTAGGPAHPNPPGPRPPITVIPPVGAPANGSSTAGQHSTNGASTTVRPEVLSPTEFDETA